MIAKTELKNYEHLAFQALLLRGLWYTQRPGHNFIIGKLLYFRKSRLQFSYFWSGTLFEKCHVSGYGCLEPEQAVTFVPSIPDGKFHLFVLLLLIRRKKKKTGPLCRDSSEHWVDVLALLCGFKHTHSHSQFWSLSTVSLKRQTWSDSLKN